MLVQPFKRKVPKIDVFSTLERTNTVLKFFGISCVSRDGAIIKYYWSTSKICFYIIFFLIINAFTIYYKIFRLNDLSINTTFNNAFEILYLFGFVQYIVGIFFVYKYGRQSYLDYLSLYDYIDSLISMPYNSKIKKCIERYCIYFIVMGFFTVSIDYISSIINFGWLASILYLVDYLYFFLRMLSALDTMSNCTQISFRLKTIGDILENYYYNSESLPNLIKDVIKHKLRAKIYRFDFVKDVRFYRNIVKNLTRSYLLLTEQNNYVNTMYGFRIMLNSVLYLSDMVILMNVIIRLVFQNMVTPYDASFLLLIVCFVRFIACSVIVFSGVHVCEESYRQSRRIYRWICHLLMNKRIPPDEYESLMQLKDLITTRPIRYHVMNFYRLEYPTLVSLASVIVTFTVIVLENMK